MKHLYLQLFLCALFGSNLFAAFPYHAIEYNASQHKASLVALMIQDGVWENIFISHAHMKTTEERMGHLISTKFLDKLSANKKPWAYDQQRTEVLVNAEDADENVLGYVSYYFNKKGKGEIGAIVIDPEIRKQGFGKHLLHGALIRLLNNKRHNQKKQPIIIIANVLASNAAAIEFYQKDGFTIKEEKKTGDIAYLVMQWSSTDNTPLSRTLL